MGIVLVLVSTVVAARWAATQDDRVAYWSLRADVRSGQPVSRSDLVKARVRLDGGSQDQYVRVVDEFPAALSALEWSHDLRSGELVRVASLRAIDSQPAGELPLKVAIGAFPNDLQSGDLVDVWVSPPQGDVVGDATKVLPRVRILDLGGDSNSVGGALAKTVVVALVTNTDPAKALAAVGRGTVTLVRVP
ncbi:MAG: hypothetical protein JWP10_359 [Nocardioidaceae bacterium]|nr:hypothetical protein [Nocardioidaceae bacterium]